MPWRTETPQERGHRHEREELRRRGARQHPRSGAGRIKLDGSTDTELIEHKSANKQLTLDGQVLRRDHVRALHAGQELVWVVRFEDAGITAEVRIESTR